MAENVVLKQKTVVIIVYFKRSTILAQHYDVHLLNFAKLLHMYYLNVEITELIYLTYFASDILLDQQILAFVGKNYVNFLCAGAADIWAEHDIVGALAMHVLLVHC